MGPWLFALGVLFLAVLHRGFRKVFLWLIAIGALLLGIAWLYVVAPAVLAIITMMGLAFLLAKGITSRGSSPSTTHPPELKEKPQPAQLREYQPPPLLQGPQRPPPA